jgi:hypothetical protein
LGNNRAPSAVDECSGLWVLKKSVQSKDSATKPFACPHCPMPVWVKQAMAIENCDTNGIFYGVGFRELSEVFLSLSKVAFDLLNFVEQVVNLSRRPWESADM